MNIITYGTFDLLHYGHIKLLKKAASYGSNLMVGLSTDAFNDQKGKESAQPYWLRKLVLESLPCVDLVVPEQDWTQKLSDIKRFNIDLLIMGSDWTGKFDDLPCPVIYLPRTEGISTTELKRLLK